MRGHNVTIRLAAQRWAVYKLLAKADGISASAWVRRALARQARIDRDHLRHYAKKAGELPLPGDGELIEIAGKLARKRGSGKPTTELERILQAERDAREGKGKPRETHTRGAGAKKDGGPLWGRPKAANGPHSGPDGSGEPE